MCKEFKCEEEHCEEMITDNDYYTVYYYEWVDKAYKLVPVRICWDCINGLELDDCANCNKTFYRDNSVFINEDWEDLTRFEKYLNKKFKDEWSGTCSVCDKCAYEEEKVFNEKYKLVLLLEGSEG